MFLLCPHNPVLQNITLCMSKVKSLELTWHMYNSNFPTVRFIYLNGEDTRSSLSAFLSFYIAPKVYFQAQSIFFKAILCHVRSKQITLRVRRWLRCFACNTCRSKCDHLRYRKLNAFLKLQYHIMANNLYGQHRLFLPLAKYSLPFNVQK